MTVEKRSAVAETISGALAQIATELELDITELDYNIDSAQFLDENGHRTSRRDVEVTGWKKVLKPGINEMQSWLSTTIEALGLEATVTVRESHNTLHFTIASEQGGQIIGRRGATLKSIEKLMNTYSVKVGYEWKYALHVDGGEERSERRGDRDDSRGRNRNDSRGDRRNDRNDRNDRRGDRRNDRNDRNDRRGDRRDNKRDEEGLKRLSKMLGNRVLESGEPLIVEKELNGYQRRIIHMAIKDFKGVKSESFDADGVRKIRLVQAEIEDSSESSESSSED